MKDLSHLDAEGRARMVDVGAKTESARTARAEGSIKMSAEALAAVERSAISKGDVLAAARIAGIMAAKKTAELIPLCHPVALTKVSVDISPDDALPGLNVLIPVRLDSHAIACRITCAAHFNPVTGTTAVRRRESRCIAEFRFGTGTRNNLTSFRHLGAARCALIQGQ